MKDHLDTIKADLQTRAVALERQQTAIGMVDQLMCDLEVLNVPISFTVDPKDPASISLSIYIGLRQLEPLAITHVEPPEPIPPVEPPVAKPVEKIDLRKGPKPKAGRARRWTEEEDERAIQLSLEGKTAREVAAALGRPLEGTKFRIGQNLRARIEARRGQPAQRAPVTASAPTSAAGPCDASLSLAERDVDARLNAVGHVAPWDPQLDLEMVELLTSGTKAAKVAEILELTKEQVVSRFRALCPGPPNMENQQRLITALRRRAAA